MSNMAEVMKTTSLSVVSFGNSHYGLCRLKAGLQTGEVPAENRL